ncbi:MAG: hypothetical protein AAGP08_16740, partial [Pseudomonadota bacterium]
HEPPPPEPDASTVPWADEENAHVPEGSYYDADVESVEASPSTDTPEYGDRSEPVAEQAEAHVQPASSGRVSFSFPQGATPPAEDADFAPDHGDPDPSDAAALDSVAPMPPLEGDPAAAPEPVPPTPETTAEPAPSAPEPAAPEPPIVPTGPRIADGVLEQLAAGATLRDPAAAAPLIAQLKDLRDRIAARD